MRSMKQSFGQLGVTQREIRPPKTLFRAFVIGCLEVFVMLVALYYIVASAF